MARPSGPYVSLVGRRRQLDLRYPLATLSPTLGHFLRTSTGESPGDVACGPGTFTGWITGGILSEGGGPPVSPAFFTATPDIPFTVLLEHPARLCCAPTTILRARLSPGPTLLR